MSSAMRRMLWPPSRIALLLGLGALSVSTGKADTGPGAFPAHDDLRVPQQSARTIADLLIWQDEGRVYLSEMGKPAEELHLSDTAEADLLRGVLQREGATATAPRVLHDRIILVGGGGAGTHWSPKDKIVSPDTAVAPPSSPAPMAIGPKANIPGASANSKADYANADKK
jgi:hypothetical protein